MLITSIKLWSVELLSITWNVSRHEDRAALWDDKFPGGIGSRSKFDSLRWWKILICHRPPYAGPRLCLSNVSFFELNKSLPSERNFMPRLLLPFLSASCNKFNSIFFALPNWFSFVLLSTFFLLFIHVRIYRPSDVFCSHECCCVCDSRCPQSFHWISFCYNCMGGIFER